MEATLRPLSWLGIVRLGLVQAALGAIVVLTTSTLNRVMVVELALPAMLPGLLVGLHYAMQIFRPRLGYGSDLGGRRTPWIIGGMAVLAAGGALAAIATAWMATWLLTGIVLAVIAFLMIGIGVGAAGTSLLVLLAKRTAPERRSAAASIAWVMMIAGFIVTTIIAGRALDPYSGGRLIIVSSTVSAIALLLAIAGIWNIEGEVLPHQRVTIAPRGTSFTRELKEIWADSKVRRFAIFIFVSMLAYSAQDLILEPFAGAVFGMTPGETTRLSGTQHSGALIGMILVPLVNMLVPAWRTRTGPWIVGGCIASALSLSSLALAALVGPPWPLQLSVLALGITNGAYAIAAIGAMMNLVGAGQRDREGTRMGVWGASQAISFGLGGLLGTLASDAARYVLPSPSLSYAAVFAAEAGLFLAAAYLAIWIGQPLSKDNAESSLAVAAQAGSMT
ncbi:BCD family MFS transporter [Bradyrhizobium guangzhouense]|uniref:BCD family MFS transporter n=1 Tax=Bradyrhizobium guangzhouense TaxID=1325095 RepID=UPI001009D0B0|nr:BCD family MFS transporter [Bradyrhizobium guangzhouense]RXH09323.1 MFS transporter [Bradyrhizobium guangzhouense]